MQTNKTKTPNNNDKNSEDTGILAADKQLQCYDNEDGEKLIYFVSLGCIPGMDVFLA